jgi:hypothetical protein
MGWLVNGGNFFLFATFDQAILGWSKNFIIRCWVMSNYSIEDGLKFKTTRTTTKSPIDRAPA